MKPQGMSTAPPQIGEDYGEIAQDLNKNGNMAYD